ncbi:MAG: hypothetical protein P8Y04_08140, partial [Desulfobulbaceae bacterium]
QSMEIPMTFADFAMTEARFRKHFRMAPPDTWHEDMVPLAEFIELEEEEREGKFPFIWSVDKRQHLTRLLVDAIMVKSSEERRDFWVMLKAIAGVVPEETVSADEREAQVRRDVVGRIASGLMKLADGGEGDLVAGAAGLLDEVSGAEPTEPGEIADAGAAGDYMAPWIDTEECTTCDECTNLNGAIFAYNEVDNSNKGINVNIYDTYLNRNYRLVHDTLSGSFFAPRWNSNGTYLSYLYIEFVMEKFDRRLEGMLDSVKISFSTITAPRPIWTSLVWMFTCPVPWSYFLAKL